ncbi:MAG: TetR/AcrR family transcriptional regulator [Lachnospiraceae bacterium]|nr:TetR/AcrR family transcriptional regulator [Lachnospiraceae bacterium]
MSEEKETLEKIHRIAEQEFLEKGFTGASLRNIVKEAGVTTGAFYGYYRSKDELFEALVKPHADYIMNYFVKVQNEFSDLSKEDQIAKMSGYNLTFLNDMLEYSYSHLTGMKILLTAATGTKYENMIHEMVEIEIESTHNFMKVMGQMGYKAKPLNPYFEHIMVSGMFTSYFELIIHDVPYEQAKDCISEMSKFNSAGWAACMGMEWL